MEDNSQQKLFFSVKLGKSYKNRGWALSRSSTIDLIPVLPYEEECDIIVDGIPAKAHFNILPRIFYGKNEKELIDHLYKLSEEGSKDRIQLQLILNKNTSSNSKTYPINELRYKLDEAEILIEEFKSKNVELSNRVKFYEDNSVDSDVVMRLKNKILELEENNRNLLNKLESKSDGVYDQVIDDLNAEIKILKNKILELEENNRNLLNKLESKSDGVYDQVIDDLNAEIKILKNKNNELEVVLAKLLKKRDEEKEIKNFVKDLASKINNLDLD